MYAHASRRTVASTACPGITFTVRRISYGRRNEIAKQLKLLQTTGKAGELENLSDAVQLLRALMGAMLLEVSGLEVDGRPFAGEFKGDGKAAAIEELLDAAPEKLIEEIHATLLDELKLGGEAEKNSAPPSGTSSAETEGGSTVVNASARACGSGATAAVIIPTP